VIDRADVVIVGAGGLGAATAFHLARLGRHVALLDRHDIGSQTSPRAAGMLSCARKSESMTRLALRARAALVRFRDETGEPLDLVACGSLKVARRPEDAAVLSADAGRAAGLGLDAALISPDAAHAQNPFLETEGVEAVLWVGEDLYFDPAQLAAGLARAAGRLGATLLPGTAAERVLSEDGVVTGVATAAGVIRTSVVVDAAGAWTREVARKCGMDVPLVPTGQQLFVTQPVEGAAPGLPMVRIMDAAVYMRPCLGGFLWGVYEEAPAFFDMAALGPDFSIADMPLDARILRSAADDVAAQLPILRTAPVREHRGGIPTMTADGLYIVGPASAGLDGFFFASGCNVAGLSTAPAIGAALAAWITTGTAPPELAGLEPGRFASQPIHEDALRRRAAWQYRHFYGAV
jgi:glycine/D-amino acid oxidase-like deaminating enzyme